MAKIEIMMKYSEETMQGIQVLKFLQNGNTLHCPICNTVLETIPKDIPKGKMPLGILCPNNKQHVHVYMEPSEGINTVRRSIKNIVKKSKFNYICVKWFHSFSNEPILIYSELDSDRWEIRKVEQYENGKFSIASKFEENGETKLSLEPIPFLEDIATDPQFNPVEITALDFENIWAKAKKCDGGT